MNKTQYPTSSPVQMVQHDQPEHRAGIGRLMKIGDVSRETSLHKATIYRRIAEGTFPAGYELGGGRKAWAESDIEAWKRRIIEGVH